MVILSQPTYLACFHWDNHRWMMTKARCAPPPPPPPNSAYSSHTMGLIIVSSSVIAAPPINHGKSWGLHDRFEEEGVLCINGGVSLYRSVILFKINRAYLWCCTVHNMFVCTSLWLSRCSVSLPKLQHGGRISWDLVWQGFTVVGYRPNSPWDVS